MGVRDLVEGRAHVVALDPPFRGCHTSMLESAARAGSRIHLYYGPAERQATQRLLRYLVHPRFAMVCVYRALSAGRADGGGPDHQAVLAEAARLAWEEAGVILGREELGRGLSILEELGLDRVCSGKAKLDARSVLAYAQAEAEYEECSRLCQSL